MKISIISVIVSLLLSGAASASAIQPIDVTFAHAAAQTLKRLGDDEARIVSSSPTGFTFCRDSSSSLWKYEYSDLEQVAYLQRGENPPQTGGKRSSPTVIETNSAACNGSADVPFEPVVKPGTSRWLALGLIVGLLLVGFRFTYRAFKHRYYDRTTFSNPRFAKMVESMPPHYSTAKALAAFGAAAVAAWIYFGVLA